MKLLLASISVIVLLSGCASVSSMYSDCDSKNQRFSDIATCTKSALKADSRYGFHKGYQASANRAMANLDFLEEKVAAGAMTEKEARFRVQELLAAMRSQDMAEFAAIQASQQPTIKTRCTTLGGITNCTSK